MEEGWELCKRAAQRSHLGLAFCKQKPCDEVLFSTRIATRINHIQAPFDAEAAVTARVPDGIQHIGGAA